MNNLFGHRFKISVSKRNQLNQHSSFLIFFTGLSGSGKSTLASAVEKKLYGEGIRTFSLDGDNIRIGINSDLGFTPEDRSENLRRIGHISKLFVDSGAVVLASFIAPYEKDREFIKKTVTEENYIEIYVSTSLEECERRDTKGLYKKAREGKIKDFTGISAPYEAPKKPLLALSTECTAIEDLVEIIYEKIKEKLYTFSNE
jgi:adenylylsulfate kinase